LQNESLQRDITDLQSEFEFDRIDYLDTIRKLEKQSDLSTALLDRIHPCLRRDCNYSNLDRIKQVMYNTTQFIIIIIVITTIIIIIIITIIIITIIKSLLLLFHLCYYYY